jgi:primosomal protein N' (replication factor Y) (superfamily II helicase)
MKFADIIFQSKKGQNTCILTYAVPQRLDPKKGQLVEITLRNKAATGLIWRLHNDKPEFNTVNIQHIIKEKPLLSEKQLELVQWISDYYFCSLDKVLKLFIPKRVFENRPIKRQAKEPKKLLKVGTKKLNEDQEKALTTIMNGKDNSEQKSNKFLIHGVTGSGKTEIYVHLTKHYLEKGKQVLILVPEISLTPQTITYFEQSLGERAIILNSKISEGVKYQAWKKIWKNESKLIIGSRSAIFSPLQDLGLIIIDEEQENSYKQDNSPRYSTHAIAEKLTKLFPSSKLVLGSATPSIETKEKYSNSTLELNERIGKVSMPQIEIIDLREEFQKKNYSIFSERLKEELNKTLANKEQAILFINRRGAASAVVCRDCGYKSECKDCQLPLTYHARTLSKPQLICHHCGKIEDPPTNCPSCQGPNIRYLGIGTQRIEDDLLKEFPGVRTLRADKDTTSTKTGFEDIYKAFKNHEADVLIGTQMIAKGLHLPKVSLVGVILADIGLNIPDFRASERNFQLMTQVAGRAGRSGTEGNVIIQTYNPDHLALTTTKNHDYQGFFNYERTQRNLLKNPPFGQIAKILVQDPKPQTLQKIAEKTENLLWKIVREQNLSDQIEINSYPAYIPCLRGQYRQIILIKNRQTISELSTNSPLHILLGNLPKEDIINPNFKIDIDPININ